MLRLTRELRFSLDAGQPGDGCHTAAVSNSWAGWPSARGVRPWLRLRVTVGGRVDPLTGLLCNIKRIDDLLRRQVIGPLTQTLRSEPDVAPARLLRLAWELIAAGELGELLLALELLTTPMLRYALDREDATMVYLTQQFEFSAAHRLHCPKLSAAENQATFGKCTNPSGHGHNYLLEVTVRGRPDQHGVVFPLPQLERIVKRRVLDVLDHKHLNVDIDLFAERNPTVENIARVVWELLATELAPPLLANVRVYETAKTWADYRGK